MAPEVQPSWFRRVFITSAHKQTKADQTTFYKWAARLGWLALFLCAVVLTAFAMADVTSGSRLWSAQMLAQVGIGKVPLGFAGIVLAYLSYLLIYKTYARSPQGRSHGIWKRQERDADGHLHWPEPLEIRVAKLNNRGRVAAYVLLGCLVFWACVLGGK